MSDDIHSDGSQQPEFEREDLAPKPILLFLLGLVVACLLVAGALRVVYGYFDAYENNHEPAQNPLSQQAAGNTRTVSQGDIMKFPQPRLETDERREIYDFREKEEETLNSYGWVDQQAGVMRIPIDRAMQLIAQRGLPTRVQTGTVPSSDVNTAKQAAQRSDTSAKPPKRK